MNDATALAIAQVISEAHTDEASLVDHLCERASALFKTHRWSCKYDGGSRYKVRVCRDDGSNVAVICNGTEISEFGKS